MGAAEADAKAYLTKLFNNVVALPGSGRDATNAFLQGSGNVLISYENEAILARQSGEDFDYIVPNATLKIENPGAVLKDANPKAKAYLDFVLNTAGQEEFVKKGFRPVVKGTPVGTVEGANDPAKPFRCRASCSPSPNSADGTRSTPSSSRRTPASCPRSRRRPASRSDFIRRHTTDRTARRRAASRPRGRRRRRRATDLTPVAGLGLGITMLWFSLLVLIPLLAVVVQASEGGWQAYWEALTSPQTAAALRLTVSQALLVTLVNIVMGTAIAWVLVRDRFWGKQFLEVVIDIPFALPTIVAGLVLLSLYGPSSPLGVDWANTRIAVFLAFLFVTLPFVVRTVAAGPDRAGTRGGGGGCFARGEPLHDLPDGSSCPTLAPAITSGAALSFARGDQRVRLARPAVGQPALLDRGRFGPDPVLRRGRQTHRGGRGRVHPARRGARGHRRAWTSFPKGRHAMADSLITPAGAHPAAAREGRHRAEQLAIPMGAAADRDRVPVLPGDLAGDAGGKGDVLAGSGPGVGRPAAARRDLRVQADPLGRLLGGSDQHRVRDRHLVAARAVHVPGRRALSAMIDVPLSVSPIVVGLALLLVYSGRTGWIGGALESAGLQVIYAPPGHHHGHRLRQPAAGDPGTRAGADRDRHGRRSRPRGVSAPSRLQSFPEHHAAGDQVGTAVRRGAQPGPFAGRVRRGQDRLRRSWRCVRRPQRCWSRSATSSSVRRTPSPPTPRPSILALIAVLALVVVTSLRPQGEPQMSIEITGVGKRFGDFVALDDIDLDIPTGQLTALLGPSGGGKSTLLRIIAGLELSDTGTVEIEGTRRHRPAGAETQRRLRLSALRSVPAPERGRQRRLRTQDPQAARRRRSRPECTSCSTLVHLSQFADRLPSQLSGGQRQRMALARALAIEPDGAAARRAIRGAGRQGTQGAADVAAPTARRGARDHGVRHPRSGGGPRGRRPDRSDQRRAGSSRSAVPTSSYDTPASEFVMSFLGPVTLLDGRLVRPHDIEVVAVPFPDSYAGRIVQSSRVGFEVRLEVALVDAPDAAPVLITLTRAEATAKRLEDGAPVWIKPVEGASQIAVPSGAHDE